MVKTRIVFENMLIIFVFPVWQYTRWWSIYLFLVAEAPPGVYIYLGYSKKDALILQRGRVKLGKKVILVNSKIF